MKLKEDVKTYGIRPELLLALMIAQSVYQKHGFECIVTSLADGKHSETSLHYAGAAVDLRTFHIHEHKRAIIANEIREALTHDYDVILESDHLHVEHQPRRWSS